MKPLPNPIRVACWTVSLFVALVIVDVAWKGLVISSEITSKETDSLIRDDRWALTKRSEIAALDSQIVTAREALVRFDASMKLRWVSREDDRIEFKRLNDTIVELENARAKAMSELSSKSK